MKLSIAFSGGVTWPRWQRITSRAEQLGFAGLFYMDHFTPPQPPDWDILELIVALTYLASHSERVHFGSLVAPLSFRDPVMLARQAIALDDLSNGRMILGVGAGWEAREHTMFGYELGDVRTRMDRLEEGLEVITRLIRSDQTVTFNGRFFQLREARLLPRPRQPGGPRLMIGGNGLKRTLPLVARFADIWNFEGATAEVFSERSAALDALIRTAGRQPNAVRRTVHRAAFCWRNREELDRFLHGLPLSFGNLPVEAVVEMLRTRFGAILGTPEDVVEQLRLYESAGADEFMIQWFGPDDVESLEKLAEYLLPHFGG